MTHYSPAAGLTKPLNQLENPIYPDIKKGPPRFVWSRKHWKVDAGATLRELEPYTNFFQPAVLAQSRTFNQTVYGQSSHKDIVNAEFRPPLIAPYEISRAANRMPCTTHAIIPHINPNGGSYKTKNERTTEIEGALNDRVVRGEIRPTFYAPLSLPQDNSILPNLELKLPSVSASAGWKMPTNVLAPEAQSEWVGDYGNIVEAKYTTPIDSGYSSSLRLDGPSGMEDIELYNNMPSVSAGAGYRTNIRFDGENGMEHMELGDNRPAVSAGAGYRTNIRFDGENGMEHLELADNRPAVSAGAGFYTDIRFDGENGMEHLELADNRPAVSASAGYQTNIRFDGENGMENLELHKKQGDAYLGALNPNGGGYTPGIEETELDVRQYIQDNRPAVSYATRQTTSYRDRNGLTHRPHFRERLQPLKSYGQIAQSGGSRPMGRIMEPQLSGLISPYESNKVGKVRYKL